MSNCESYLMHGDYRRGGGGGGSNYNITIIVHCDCFVNSEQRSTSEFDKPGIFLLGCGLGCNFLFSILSFLQVKPSLQVYAMLQFTCGTARSEQFSCSCEFITMDRNTM